MPAPLTGIEAYLGMAAGEVAAYAGAPVSIADYPYPMPAIAGEETTLPEFDGEGIAPPEIVRTSGVISRTPTPMPAPMLTPGAETLGLAVTPTALPLVGAVVGGGITIGILKGLLAKFGPVILKSLIGAGAFAAFLKLIGFGAGDETVVPGVTLGKKKAKRYSIGKNPRLNTLLKVGKRVDNIFASYDARVKKFRSRLRGVPAPRRAKPRYYGPSQYLSPVERKQLARR